MEEKYDRPVSRDDLLFTVEMSLLKASRFWPRKRVPGDHDRLKPVAAAVVAHLELCGMRLFPEGAGAASQHAESVWRVEPEWR